MSSDLQEALLTAGGAAALVAKHIDPVLLENQRRYAPLVRALPSVKWGSTVYYFNKTDGFDQARDMLDRYSNLNANFKPVYVDPDKKPAVHATPLNHVGLWVDDLPKAVEWMTANGVRFAPGGIRKGAAGYDICFLHPKASDEFPIAGEGVLVELVQAPPEVIAALG